VKVGEVETATADDWSVRFRERYRGKAGSPLTLSVTRGGQAMTLTTEVRERTVVSFTLTPATAPTAKQTRIWQGLTTGSTGN
jgi:hypothetical protein